MGTEQTRPRAPFSGIPATDAPPFTHLSTPVYSLSSCGAGGAGRTMNIVTYASPIAIKPARKYVVGLYVETLSWRNILQQSHSPLLQLLGKSSGRDVDKEAEARRLGFKVVDAFGLPVLEDCAGAMELRLAGDFIPCGDHEVAIFDVVGWKDMEGPTAPLYTEYLKKNGFL
ncbi:hypothetical protein MNEG_5894 [Monoraphidium neglectum]|uniref:Flavin reductase like domain-containing protein n=1 Tax=Monoraphidium neglectum TaxID=145388 RepID=A0A0D2L4P5_9CHLO|nr:hypothetical protein MNEG_5894 [Monoraphidium neglectum]KIZ02069.1 hypothetical protein MNEG_5894 [Monoraphidium neglectum]|eukprot:XP_013901088.1 hypothetical protein MNEG_5894 [Monoraphidium neglectum]